VGVCDVVFVRRAILPHVRLGPAMAADKLPGTSSRFIKPLAVLYIIRMATDHLRACFTAKADIWRNEAPLRLA